MLYEGTARRAAWELVASWTYAERLELEQQTPVHGLRTPLPRGQGLLVDRARALVAIAADGLSRAQPECESELEPLVRIVTEGRSRADEILALYQQHGATPALAAALRLT